MFFAKRFRVSSVDGATGHVLDCVTTIEFRLDNGGKKLNGNRALRPAYDSKGIETNAQLYICDFIPECSHIFTATDVEMAIFAWCTRERARFDVARRS